jgi:RNA 3'-terminal phosphate cyclase (ATP)
MTEETIEIDGSFGEGGGQIVRTAVALSAVTGKAVKINNIRAKRPNPGLSWQHITAIDAVRKLCNASIYGLKKGSPTLEFKPYSLKGGSFKFDVGTAGSITLVLQACLLPALFCDRTTEITITGGTDVAWSPPIDYFRFVFLNLLKKNGCRC